MAPVSVSETIAGGGRADARMRKALAAVPAGPAPQRPERRPLLPLTQSWPPQDFAPRTVHDYWFAATPPVRDGGTIGFELATVDPAFDVAVLDVKGVDYVALVIVGIPRELRASAPKSARYLYFWRPPPNTNGDRYGPTYAPDLLGPYPYNFDFGFYGIWNYLNYRADPLTCREERWMPSKAAVAARGAPGLREVEEKFTFGLPYQIRRSAQPFVLVQPVFGIGSYPGGLQRADTAAALLDAVHAWLWKSPDAEPPAIGGVALAGYSFGAEVIAKFVVENRRSRLVDTLLRDAILLDPPSGTDAAFANIGAALDQWAAAGAGRRRIALYSQTDFPSLPRDVPRPRDLRKAFLGQNAKWRYLYLPQSSWVDAQNAARKADAARLLDAMKSARAVGGDTGAEASASRAEAHRVLKESASDEYARENRIDSYDAVHFAIPAMLLTDALRTSPA